MAVQATTAIMSKVLDSKNSNKPSGLSSASNLVANLIPSSTGDILKDYPLNLLTDMNTLLICALIFIYYFEYITKYIISKDLKIFQLLYK